MLASVVTDASVDLSPETAGAAGLVIAPVTYTLAGRRYLAGAVDGETPDLYGALEEGAEAKVIGVEPDDFESAFRAAAEAAEAPAEVVCVCQSFGSTFTYVSAEVAARRVSDLARVRIINTGRSTMGQAAIALLAARAAQSGADLGTVASLVEQGASHADSYVLQPSLDHLERTGTRATIESQSSVGRFEDGVPLFRARGRLSAVALCHDLEAAEHEIAARIATAADGRPVLLVASHARAPEAAARLAGRVAAEVKAETLVTEMGPVLGSILGPGAYGAGFCVIPEEQ